MNAAINLARKLLPNECTFKILSNSSGETLVALFIAMLILK